MSHKKRGGLFKRVTKFVARQARKDVHIATKITNKISPYVTGVVAGAASYFGGPVAGAAVGAVGSEISFMTRRELGRQNGESFKSRNQKARSVRRRSAVAAGVGLGVGAIAGGITTAALGGTFSQSIASAGTGQFGGQLLGTGAPGIFADSPSSLSGIVTAGNFGAQVASPVSGIVTTIPGGAGATGSLAAIAGPAASGPGIWGGLATAAVTGLAGGAAKALTPGQNGTNTGGQAGLFDSFARGAEMAALQAAGGSGQGGGGLLGGSGDPGAAQSQTNWFTIALIAGGVFLASKYL